MDRGSCLVYLLLLCVWCSLDTSLLIGVNGQIVILNKVSIGVSTEGGSVELICAAFGLQDGNIIEWLREVNSEIIARNGISLNTTKYFLAETDYLMARSENILIFTLTKHDTGSYICRIKSSDEEDAMILTTSDNYYLSVLYFPAAIYPICFPDGPFNVQEGTTLNMNCTTERGNPRVRINVFAYGVALLTWTHTTEEEEPGASFQLQVSAVDTNSSYECIISSESISSMEGSCTIGPINVVPMSMTTLPGTTQKQATQSKLTTNQQTLNPSLESSTEIITQPSTSRNGETIIASVENTTETLSDTRTMTTTTVMETTATPIFATPFPIAIIAGISGGGAFLLLLSIVIVVCVCKRTRSKDQKQKSPLKRIPLYHLN